MPKTVIDEIRLFAKGLRDDLSQADCYFHGLHVEKDFQVAEVLYKKAAAEHVRDASYKLGVFYQHLGRVAEATQAYFNAFLEGNFQEGRRATKALILLGLPAVKGQNLRSAYIALEPNMPPEVSSEAPSEVSAECVNVHLYLGQIFEIEENWEIAQASYKIASVGQGQSGPEAMFNLGALYEANRMEKGKIIIAQDESIAYQWYQNAAFKGFEPALAILKKKAHTNALAALFLAPVYGLKSRQNALGCYFRSNDLGNAEAAFRLGEIHEKGELAVTQDQVKALEFYFLAAKRNHFLALAKLEKFVQKLNTPVLQYQLAEVYEKSFEDKNQALKWYKKSMDQAYREAENRMLALASSDPKYAYAAGWLYETDTIGKKDPQKANFYYALAMRNGHQEAQVKVVSQAESGNAEAQYALGNYSKQHDQAAFWYKKSADQGHLEAQDQISMLASSEPEFAYAVGYLYETDWLGIKDLKKAYFYYALAMRKGHGAAQTALESQAESGNAEAQYTLGCYYYAHQQKPLQAVNICVKAAEQGHKQADNYLKNTSFTADIYLELAERYREGRGVKVNIHQTIAFYHRAHLLKNSEAAFQLAKIYEATDLKKWLDPDLAKAHELYLLAAQWGHTDALPLLTERADQSKNPLFEHQIAQLYYTYLKENHYAARRYVKAIHQGYAPALQEFVQLSKSNAEFAYLTGWLYETDEHKKPDLEKVFFLYALATRNGHEAAKKLLENRAESGLSEAQYMLGFEVYAAQKNITLAVKWCMRAAEKGYAQALDYLRKTNFDLTTTLEIAKQYEQGLGVATHIQSAIYFYTRAHQLKDKSAALKLGHLYASSAEGREENLKKACEYYIIAAENGYLDALDPLEVLAETAPSSIQLKIADFYRKMAANRPDQALVWQLRAGKNQAVVGAKTENSAVFFNAVVSSAAARKGPKATDLTAKINRVALGIE